MKIREITNSEMLLINGGTLDDRGFDKSNTNSCCVYDKYDNFVLNPYTKHHCNVVCELADPRRIDENNFFKI